MCGIFGVYYFNNFSGIDEKKLLRATETLKQRGPDGSGIYNYKNCGLGHTRLSVIDLREIASQPMSDETGRYTIVFNGECYNYRQLRKKLLEEGVTFFSESDTEVILKMYIKHGSSCLQYLNGCFAIAIYDNIENRLFVARDRLGIKPVIYYTGNNEIVFASELKAILSWGIYKEPDPTALSFYFQLNYIPAPLTILKHTYKLMPGQYLIVDKNGISKNSYWVLPSTRNYDKDYEESKKELRELLFASVERRLISDVPLGCFLSGGIDSAVIAGIASKYKPDLNTFTISFPGMGMYDESENAEITARLHNTRHTCIPVSQKELSDNIIHVLDTTDEPFADSSAIAVNILSKVTRKYVTVALSGDGADEMFGGYNKHSAHLRALTSPLSDRILQMSAPVLGLFSEARSGNTSNKVRKAKKYLKGKKLDDIDRYWSWCCISDINLVNDLLINNKDNDQYDFIKKIYTSDISGRDMNEILHSDMRLVLPNDMLTKADKFSMSEGLEVRVPFLDHTVAEHVITLRPDYKITGTLRKKILKDTFADIIPPEILNSPKHGFEVPIEKWMKEDLRPMLNDYTDISYIKSQGIFRHDVIGKMINQIDSGSPEDSPARLWALLVFQHWWKKYID